MYFRRKKNGKWLFEINKKGYPRLSKGFDDLRTGKKWASKIEHEIETGQFEDLTKASKTTIRALLEKYRDEITVDKKGHREETAKITKHPLRQIQQATHRTSLRKRLQQKAMKWKKI